jgi:hypothetical protein
MIIFFFAAESLAKFLELMKQGLLEWQRPERCQCGEEDCFWVHGSYWRIVEEYELREKIEVKRYKCQWCGVTVSLLPCFVIPRRRYSMNVIASGVEAYGSKATSYREEVKKLGELGPSHTQLFGWVELVLKRVKELTLDVRRTA